MQKTRDEIIGKGVPIENIISSLGERATVGMLADISFDLGVRLRFHIIPLYPSPFLKEAWERLAHKERTGEDG